MILSAADEKSLDFRQKLVTSQETIEDLKVDTKKLDSGLAEMKKHRAALLALEPELQRAIVREQTHNRTTGPELATLDRQKQADNLKTQKVLAQLKEVESNITKDLASGLITQGDAATQLAALNQAKGAYTDSKIAEVLLTDSVLDKTTTGTNSLDVLVKQAELRSEVAQLDVALNVAEKQLQEESQQIDRLRQAIQTAKQSPYYLNASGEKTLYFAFIPYDNQASAVYKATTGAQQNIQYALSGLEKEALRNRLALIEQASKSLDVLMEETSKMVEAQNATRLMLFSLQTTKIKLDADRADTQSRITALYTPPLSDKPLKTLVAEKQNREGNEQRALDRLSRQNNWDVALSVGVHQQVNPVAQDAQPYGAVSVNYNFASRAIDKHLDHAVEAHDEWKKAQEGDVVRSMEVLRQQLVQSISVQEAKLKSLQEEGRQIDRNLQLVGNADTSAAFDFHNQLTAAQLLLGIETGDASFRIGRLREYLANNY